jgi:hypothetical protein
MDVQYKQGWSDAVAAQEAWQTYHKGIQTKGFIIGVGLLSAFAFFAMMAGAISMIRTDLASAIPVALIAVFLGVPLFLGPAQFRWREEEIKKREEARAVLVKFGILKE